MPTAVNKSPSAAAGNKRKEIGDDSADDDESHPLIKLKKEHICSRDGCTSKVYSRGGVCKGHGARKRVSNNRCNHEGCTSYARMCVKHGANKLCSFEGCPNKAVIGGVCDMHGAMANHYIDVNRANEQQQMQKQQQIQKQLQHNRMRLGDHWLYPQSYSSRNPNNSSKLCSVEECKNKARNGGVCTSHGAKGKPLCLCVKEGCANIAVIGGVCSNHRTDLVVALLSKASRSRSGSRGNEHQQIQNVQQQQQQQQQQQRPQYMVSTSGCSSLDHHPYLQQWNGNYNYHNHSSLNPNNWAWEGRHSYYDYVEGRNMETLHKGLRWEREESSVAAQVNDQRSRIQEGKSYNDLVTMMGMENNEGKEEGEKKQPPTPREESSVAAQASSVQRDHEDSPPKKRHRYECSFEGCKSLAQQGGLCQRHGAKVKLCNFEGCTNQAQNGKVCIRHGAKSKHRLCSVEGCTKLARTGRVCMRHGAKRNIKLCNFEGCTNQVRGGGVCVRHGAKTKRKNIKLCSSEGCTNQVWRGGVCKRHEANSLVDTPSTNSSGSSGNEEQQIQRQPQIQQEMTQHQQLGRIQEEDNRNELASMMEMSDSDDAFDAQLGCVDEQEDCEVEVANPKQDDLDTSELPYNSTWGGHLYCNIGGCNEVATHSDLCSTHWAQLAALLGNVQRSRIQEGDSQNIEATMIEMSVNKDEEEEETKQSPDAGQTRKTDVSKQKSVTSTSNDTRSDGPKVTVMNEEIVGSKGTNKDSKQNGVPEQLSLGRVVNLKDDNAQGKSGTVPQKRACAGNLKDDREQDASDVALKQGDEGVVVDATEDGDSWGGGNGQKECDYEGEDGRDERTTKDADDTKLEEMTMKSEAEKADPNSQVQASSKESNESTNQVEINAAQKNEATMRKMIDDFAAERRDFESKLNQQQSTIEGLRDELKGQKVELKDKDEKIEDMKRKDQISADMLREAYLEMARMKASLEEAKSRNVLLTKQMFVGHKV